MTGKDLFEGMNYVDERFVDEAERAELPKPRVIPWIRIASMAACLCLILFGIHHLMPTLTPGDPESIEDTAPNGSLEDPQEQESNNSNLIDPGDIPTGEIPNVILYVEEITVEGFIATVTDYGETDRLGLGTRLNVIVTEGTRHENADGDNAAIHDSKTDLIGCYVVVNFFEFNETTGTIVVDAFSIVEEEG